MNCPTPFRLLDRLPGVPEWVVGDRGYTSHAFREHIWDLGARPAIPPQRHEAPVACPDWIYNNRNQVERLVGQAQGVARHRHPLREDRRSFMGVLCLAAALDWLKRLTGPSPGRVAGANTSDNSAVAARH